MPLFRDAKSIAVRLFHWWIASLRECIPARTRPALARILFTPAPKIAVLFKDDQTEQFFEIGGEHRDRLSPIHGSPYAQSTFDQSSSPLLPEMVLLLDRQKVLERSVSLPMSAKGDLETALPFSIEQLTPLKLDEASWDWSITSLNQRDRTIDVDLYVTPKWALENVLSRSRRRGIAYRRIDVADTSRMTISGVNLSRSSGAMALPKPGHGLVMLFLILAASISAFGYVTHKQSQTADTVIARVETLRTTSLPVYDAMRELQAAHSRLDLLNTVQSSMASPSSTIDELSRILPDNTWLFEVSIDDQEVTIAGESTSASELLSLIDASQMFANSGFVSALTRGSAEGAERFVLAFEVVDEGNS